MQLERFHFIFFLIIRRYTCVNVNQSRAEGWPLQTDCSDKTASFLGGPKREEGRSLLSFSGDAHLSLYHHLNTFKHLQREGSLESNVYLSVFDGLAKFLNEKFAAPGVEPKVVVPTNINPKLVGAVLASHMWLSCTQGGDEHPGDGMPGGDALKRSPLGLNSRNLKQSGCSGDSNVEGERATTGLNSRDLKKTIRKLYLMGNLAKDQPATIKVKQVRRSSDTRTTLSRTTETEQGSSQLECTVRCTLPDVHIRMYTSCARFWCTLLRVHFPVYTSRCTLTGVHFSVYTFRRTLLCVHFPVYTCQCTLPGVYFPVYTSR
ncbi:unnamed protein product, partial [Brassica oleracea var. botrytis]